NINRTQVIRVHNGIRMCFYYFFHASLTSLQEFIILAVALKKYLDTNSTPKIVPDIKTVLAIIFTIGFSEK
ncbi:hypothetical protein J9332_38860, partial [Aquimarina celericrescens]|nr:hypothetical protein [Aquimarina celericrescens]